MYLRTQADGPIWQSSSDQPVQIKILEVKDKHLTAEFVSGQLASTAGGNPRPVTGLIDAVLE